MLNETDILILRAMFRNNLRAYRVAKDLFYARSTVDYHIYRIKEITGLDCRDFYDAIKLLEIYGEETNHGC